MREIIESRLARLSELEESLADPALVSDRVRYREIQQEYKHLREIAGIGKRYLAILDGIEGAKAILDSEDDPDMVELAREELHSLEDQLGPMEEELEVLLLPHDPDDSRDAIMEIRAGTGGEEAALFAQDLARMYQRFAERQGWKLEMLDLSESATGGVKEAIFSLKGENAYGRLRHESGVHRVQRVPVTESQGRIHTSACSVVVLPEAEEVEVDIDPADLRIDVFRSSGPGGQSVNTTDSAVRVTHLPTGLVVTCQDEKSQHKNKAKALKVLRARLYEQARREQADKEAAQRKAQVGSGDRSAKIRTYNFPQTRVTDHRIHYTAHNLHEVLDGDLDELLDELAQHYREQLFAAQTTRT
jgi:peptide chain release factor 1